MTDQSIQASFNSGEWSPKLFARVDQQKYRSGAALLRNWFVDYRGGVTTRPGTQYILQTRSSNTVRLIPFQASFTVSYVLEFGDLYIRFYANGAPILEPSKAVTAATNANPGVFTSAAHGFSNGDWVLAANLGGMTQVNGNYYIIAGAAANTLTLTDLNGVAVDTTAFGVYTAGGTFSRVYTVTSPYLASELVDIKFAQNVSQMVLCHPNHLPQLLTLISSASWTIAAISFGATVTAPTGQTASTTLAAGSVYYAYVITAVDSSGQESIPSAFATLDAHTDLRTTSGTNTITWNAVTGALFYNVYKAEVRYGSAVPTGQQFGFIGNSTSLTFIDSNIAPDYSQTPPVPQNPFLGTGVSNITVTTKGTVTIYPGVTIAASPGVTATAIATVESLNINILSGGINWFGQVGQTITFGEGIILQVSGVDGTGHITSINYVSRGSYIGAAGTTLNTGPFGQLSTTSSTGSGVIIESTWRLSEVQLTSPGTGYGAVPAVSFTNGGTSAATASLGTPSAGNPTVPGYFQQRLVLAGPVSSPQQFNMSQTGQQFDFDTSLISKATDAISGTLVSGQLNTIQALITQPQGLIILSDRQAWLVNGGSPGSAVSPAAIVANPQAYNGTAGQPPIVANDHVLYVQSKGSIVRDLVFNFYTQVYTGKDISILSSHLFYGYQILEWAWAEEPYKLVWAVRSDGALLTLTFLPEQELIAWAHSDTTGAFRSVASITEATNQGNVDAPYFVVQRTINGNNVQYIERLTDLPTVPDITTAWQIDAGISFSGAASLTFSGAQHLAAATVTGIATTDDGITAVITPFVMPTSGTFTLPTPAAPGTGYTSVIIGLSFVAQLQTLPLDLGEPTVQGKVKKINNVDVRVSSTLGLSIGSDFNHLTAMKDLVRGNVSSMLTGQTSQVITDLFTGDARTWLDPTFTVPGQYAIQQSDPLPATILGVIPNVTVGDDGGRRG